MRLARVLGAVGRILITAGTLILLFVAYQLWGTGIREAQAQNRLEKDFAEALAEVDDELDEPDQNSTSTTSTSEPAEPEDGADPAVKPGALPPPVDGDPIAHIRIPAIGVDKIVVQGVGLDYLQLGPGHYPETPMPGQRGNAAIAGHRTTYGAPFHRLDELKTGDEIFIDTYQGNFLYEVVDAEEHVEGAPHRVVYPEQVEVLDDFEDNRLTLTACHPKYSAAQRIVVVAKMNERKGQKAEEFVPTQEQKEQKEKRLDESIGETGAARWPAIAWGLVCAAIWIAAWLIGRWWRKWPAYFLGLPVFLVALFFFFEEFSRLLPSNY